MKNIPFKNTPITSQVSQLRPKVQCMKEFKIVFITIKVLASIC